jgi:hypothetical protein
MWSALAVVDQEIASPVTFRVESMPVSPVP